MASIKLRGPDGFPKRPTQRASKVFDDPALFDKTEGNLLRTLKRPWSPARDRAERFWREVLGAYAGMIFLAKRRRRIDKATADRGRKAEQYWLGLLPPREAITTPFDGSDDSIPF